MNELTLEIKNNKISSDILYQINYLITTGNIKYNDNVGIIPGYTLNAIFFDLIYVPYKNLDLGNLVYYNYATYYSDFLNKIVVLSLPISIKDKKITYYDLNNNENIISNEEKENIILGIIVEKYNANENLYTIFKFKNINYYSFGINLAIMDEKKYNGIIDLQKNSIINNVFDFSIYNKIYLYKSKNGYAKLILADNDFLLYNDGIFIGNAILIDEFRLSCLFEYENRL